MIRLAAPVATSAASGTATTIRPFTRTDRLSHHRRGAGRRRAAGSAELAPRTVTTAPE
jgi:hypothetical protein